MEEWIGIQTSCPPPAIHGDKIIVVNKNINDINCFDINDGKKLWMAEKSDKYKEYFLDSYPALSGGCIYIGDHCEALHAIDISNGKITWEYHGAKSSKQGISNCAIASGRLFVSSSDSKLYCFGAKDDSQPSWTNILPSDPIVP